jgi:hypothetical protein
MRELVKEMVRHIHKFRRIDIGKKGPYWVMQCRLPHCNYFVPMATKLSVPALIGKIALCNKCNDPFELDRMALRKSKPVCNSCVVSPNKDKLDKAAKFFVKLEGEIVNLGIPDELEE